MKFNNIHFSSLFIFNLTLSLKDTYLGVLTFYVDDSYSFLMFNCGLIEKGDHVFSFLSLFRSFSLIVLTSSAYSS